jgi:hypothetical protein
MQPEQPNTPSTDIQTSDAVTDKPVSDEQREGSSPGWWQRLFNRNSAEETPTESGEPGDTSGASQTLKLTEEELQRRVQSEADRREAKRIQEEKRAQRRKLRDEDPSASSSSSATSAPRTIASASTPWSNCCRKRSGTAS